jgi:hypothetical protein
MPIRGDGTVFLGEPVVVAADHGFVDDVMGDVAPEHGPRDHGGGQDLGVEAVLVLFAYALLGAAGAGGVFDFDAEGLPGAGGVAGPEVEEVGFEEGLALDHQGVAAVGEMDGVRGSVIVLGRDAMGPALGRDFEVTVGGDEGVRAGHGGGPPFVLGEVSAGWGEGGVGGQE